ncbi:NAD(P)H-dependent oxidoreductase [Leisingera sp. M527]|uniref:FMN-dependent NADH-azoreductase n=1 Tax=Leisingera sp. M527 TaxID=2867014 RepID=UPI0021A357B6|nr:NAD(P)H-dependent oxidoreductase [Leisingera sp. M527]UWQ33824.1 NAD(P)H-dependent oxidoreductase [Leisingera sp. M527]
MTKLLFIKASPRGDDSKSTAVANAYLAKLQAQDAQLEVDVLDLSAETLPDFDGDKVAAKMNIITGQDQDASQRTAWDEITTMAHRFISADIYLIASPMWNGSIPYKFKQYIDLVHQPGLLWGLDPEKGYFGLLEGKKAVLALTSGAYGPNMPSPAFGVDHQSAYLKFWLNQAGVENIEEIRFQPTLLTADPEAGFQAAVAEAEKLAS